MKLKTSLLLSVFICVHPWFSHAATPVQFCTDQLTGQTINKPITIVPTANKLFATNHLIYAGLTITLAPVNGCATTNLMPGGYDCTIQGVSQTFTILVSDTNITLVAADILVAPTAAAFPGASTAYSYSLANATFARLPTNSPGAAGQVVTSDGANTYFANGGGGGGGYTPAAGESITVNLSGATATISVVTNKFELAGNAAAQAQIATNGLAAGLAAGQMAVNGTGLQSGTVNSNALDTLTKAQLALAGSGSSGISATAASNIAGAVIISTNWVDQRILGGAFEIFGTSSVSVPGRFWAGGLGIPTNIFRHNFGTTGNADDTTATFIDPNGFAGITAGSISSDTKAQIGYGQEMVVGGMMSFTNFSTQAGSFWDTNAFFFAPNSLSFGTFTSQNNVATVHASGSGNDALTINTTASPFAPFGTFITSAVVGNNAGSGYVTGDLIELAITNVTQRFWMGQVTASGGAVTAITVVNIGQLTNSADVEFFSYAANQPGTTAQQTQYPVINWDTHKGTWQMMRGWANGSAGYSHFHTAPVGSTFDGKYGYLGMQTSASNTFNATGTITASGRTITGSGTAFLSQLRPGIEVGVGSDTVTIESVTSDTVATTVKTFTESAGSTLIVFPAAFEAYGIVTSNPYDITSGATRVDASGNLSIIQPGSGAATALLSSGGKAWDLTAGSDGHFTLNTHSSAGGAAALFLDYATPNGWLESDSSGNANFLSGGGIFDGGGLIVAGSQTNTGRIVANGGLRTAGETNTGSFALTSGTLTSGFVLTEDASGNGTWQAATGGGGSGIPTLAGSGTNTFVLGLTTASTNTFAGSGTITISGTAVVGVGTHFTTEVQLGELIGVSTTTAPVVVITDDTHLTLGATLTGSSVSYVVFGNSLSAVGIVPVNLASGLIVNASGSPFVFKPAGYASQFSFVSGSLVWNAGEDSTGHFFLSTPTATPFFIYPTAPNAAFQIDGSGNWNNLGGGGIYDGGGLIVGGAQTNLGAIYASGVITGNGGGLTNLLVSGIETNGATAVSQYLGFDGKKVAWTNAPAGGGGTDNYAAHTNTDNAFSGVQVLTNAQNRLSANMMTNNSLQASTVMVTDPNDGFASSTTTTTQINSLGASQAASNFWASPATTAGSGAWRGIAATDIPALPGAIITSGTVAAARLPGPLFTLYSATGIATNSSSTETVGATNTLSAGQLTAIGQSVHFLFSGTNDNQNVERIYKVFFGSTCICSNAITGANSASRMWFCEGDVVYLDATHEYCLTRASSSTVNSIAAVAPNTLEAFANETAANALGLGITLTGGSTGDITNNVFLVSFRPAY